MSENTSKFIGTAAKGQRIRNGQLRRVFERLLEIIASPSEPDFEEVEGLANKYRFYFDETGEVVQIPEERRARR